METKSRTLVINNTDDIGSCRAGTFPQKYVQGMGILKNINAWTAVFGKRALLIGGKRALTAVEETIKESLSKDNADLYIELFNGESTAKEISRIENLAVNLDADYLIAAGGGKVIDSVKEAAYRLKKPVVIVPTVASTDAPTSVISVVYDEEGRFLTYTKQPYNPNMVFLDTKVIAEAPFKYLAAGIGGAMAISYEAPSAERSRAISTAGARPIRSAILLAKGIREILIRHTLEAKISVERNIPTESLDAVVEAVLLMSGIGFESGGLSAAHAVYHGYRYLNKKDPMMHGEIVSFGLIVQMILMQNDPNEINEIVTLFASIGLPVTFKQMSLTNEDVEIIAHHACTEGTVKNLGFYVPDFEFAGAMHLADEMGQNKLKELGLNQ